MKSRLTLYRKHEQTTYMEQAESKGMSRRSFLIGYDRSVPRLRQANRCIGCGQCSPKCPQGIDIPSQMRMIDDYVEQLKQGKFKR